jgi:hypothetical protein
MNEPSLLDYLKGKLFPWKYPPVQIPLEESSTGKVSAEIANDSPSAERQLEVADSLNVNLAFDSENLLTVQADHPLQESERTSLETKETISVKIAIPWLALTALCLAIFAQYSLEPRPERTWLTGVLFFFLSFACLGMAIYRREWPIAPIPEAAASHEPLSIRRTELLTGLVLGLLAFLTSGGNRFNLVNSLLLITSVLIVMRAFWISKPEGQTWRNQFSVFLQKPEWTIHITPRTLLIAGLVTVAVFFRFWNLEGVPAEMNSDHAEKILDVYRLLQGQSQIFFPNNGGREALQMYLVAGLVRFTGMPLGFITLKFSTALIGFLSLIFLYLLGKEYANPRVGLIAFAFAGVAYWPNVVSRLGLRLPFYILFTAAFLYLLLRGLKNNRRNDLLLAGLVLGISLYGYSADRILPLLALVVLGIYLLHPASKPYRKETLLAFCGLVLVAAVLFMPTFRFLLESPEAYFNRTLSRMSNIEKELPGSVFQIFFTNLGRALTMVSWSDGEVWTISVPYRPALDFITGALYWLGLALVMVRIFIKRHWIDISMLVSIPILLLPSVLSLAFPAENPNLYRTSGMLIPVFLLIALALDGLMTSLEKRLPTPTGKVVAGGLILALFLVSSLLSYHLVFTQYDLQYRLSAWNSSEMGQVIRNFGETTGSPETAWVIGYPHWVDTRLVGMIAGQTIRDVAFPIEKLSETVADPRPKLFIVFPQDEASLSALNSVYPQGILTMHVSKTPTKDFFIFYVPPTP